MNPTLIPSTTRLGRALLALSLIFTLAACGTDDVPANTNPDTDIETDAGDTGTDTQDPDAEDPDAEDPDAADPDAEDPDAEDPDAEDPDAEDPDAEDPDAEDPDAEDPDAEDPFCGDDIANTDEEECDGADLADETCETLGFDGGTLGCSDTCGFDTSACTIDPVCGDDAVNTDEEACDGSDLADETCETLGFDGGTLGCSDTCGLDTSACTIDPVCGDDAVNTDEEACDGTDLAGETCESLGFDGGTLGCSDTCGFDTSACTTNPVCGDDTVNTDEEVCDGADLGGQTCESLGFDGGTLGCSDTCGFDTSACTTNPVCGDDTVNTDEEVCDGADFGGQTCESLGFDGGTLGCSETCDVDTSACTTNPVCGDDTVNTDEEVCDGTDLGGQTCESLGFDGGTLACSDTCGFDTSACTSTPFVCADFEGPESNDTLETATSVDMSNLPVQDAICGSDEVDVYTFNATVECNADVVFTFGEGDDVHDVYLYNVYGELLSFDESDATTKTLSTATSVNGDPRTTGFYAVLFAREGSENSYEIDFQNVVCDPVAVCPADDRYESNDTLATSTPIDFRTILDASICSDDVDYYTISLPLGCQVTAQMQPESGQDFDLTLSTATRQLDSSQSGSGQVDAVQGGANTSSYYLRVEPFGGATGAYTLATDVLDITCADAPTCPTDDAFVGNTTLDTAYALEGPSAILDGAICTPDDDFYKIFVPEGCKLDSTLEFTHADGDLDLFLYNTAGSLDTSSTGATDTELVSTGVVTDGGVYRLAVSGYNGATNTYRLRNTITCADPVDRLSCPADDVFAPNASSSSAIAILPNNAIDGVICRADDEPFSSDFYRIEVFSSGTLTATLSFLNEIGDLDLTLFDSALSSLDISLASDVDEENVSASVTPGTYYLEVLGYGNGAYNLETSFQ
ncbi:hypothetical protein [Lujinxingia vulgaris]|uniref:hypothetical protein n=1 Tax=Lujinxingia vulgaris TaxID=2600176 RepID=UPI001E3852DD|nr:hypothetical protein [Lujinxingia vulgaris]